MGEPLMAMNRRKRERIMDALIDDRNRAIREHGEGAWDVADVMAVLDALGVR